MRGLLGKDYKPWRQRKVVAGLPASSDQRSEYNSFQIRDILRSDLPVDNSSFVY